ncbi:geranylgeranyl reductase [Candidatus Tenderia electrophaga]|jgi:flavin-dependent dehydrogenase|uniref:Geranylgeranyl reductase n=1 Tax=Candidatus Tenderia electrophaga TaxID=1748243 RepID=A0A0S2TDQ6_9GAMM|nr:geranylgeranyl reductase [Candidatus Tenderia electrophaga]
MEHYDVLIVGGGPAGSTCAKRLQAAGLDVLVLDKKHFPRDKVCAGWVTPAVIDALGFDCEDYRRGRVLQPFYGFRTGTIGGAQVTTDYDQVVSYGIRRCEFDHYLLERCGARLELGQPIKQIECANGRWQINARFSAPLLIGAGGHFCPVARALGTRLGSDEHVISAQEVEFEMTPAQAERCAVDAHRPELFFCNDLKGYGWAVRKQNVLNVGLGREDNHRLGQHVAAFRQFLIDSGRIPSDTPEKFHGHAYLLSRQKQPRPLATHHALLIGDACGLAYAQSGEGIRPAIESALLAADIIVGADGDYRRERLKEYEDKIVARFGQRQAGGDTLGWLPDGLRHLAARKLLGSAWFSRHVLIERWFLHTHQAALPAQLKIA